jgi:transposase
MDLFHADRDELLRIIRLQQETIAEQARRVARLEQEVADLRQTVATLTAQLGGGTMGGSGAAPSLNGMPGLKAVQAPDRPAGPRKPRASGAGRRRMAATRREVHALGQCPRCGAGLSGGTVKRTREVIELPSPRMVVTEHQYVERRCGVCGTRCVPAPDLGGVVQGKGRIGHGLTSLLVLLREEARLPVRTIQALLQTLTGLQLSVGAIVAASQRVAARAAAELAAIEQAIRASPVVHLDETGWRQDGRNGFVWTASTPQQRSFVYGTRQKAMVDRLIGAEYPGVVVSDFYTAYTGDDRVHQYCWAHLLRDIDELRAQHPGDGTLQGWAAAVVAVYGRAVTAATGPATQRAAARQAAEAELTHLCQPWLAPRVPQTALCARIGKHLSSLFVFVTEPTVPPTNNAAERSLRHLVTMRKISGGTRSARGTTTRVALASLFGTWRLQGVNPYRATFELLASP